MAKMYFTFKWGKSIYVTNDDLKKILLNYYTKEEVDNLLKQYTKTEDLLDILTRYAELDYVEREVERLDTKIDSVEDTLNSDIDELGNHVNDNARDLRTLEGRVTRDEELIGDNSENITKNKIILDEVVTSLKNAKLWNIIGYYDNSVTYNIGNVVGYTDDNLYLCLVDNTVGIPPTNTSNWLKVSGVQSVRLEDYYDKTEINNLLSQYYKRTETYNKTELDTKVTNLQNQINTKANTSDVDNIKANYVTTNTTQTISGNKTFSGTTTTGALTVDSQNGITVKSGSTRYKIYGSDNNLILQNLDNTDFKKIMIANSRGETRNLLDLNDYFSLENKVNNLIKKKVIPFSQFGYVNGSEHSGYYNTTYNNNTGISGDIIGIKLDTKNNSYSIQMSYSQAGVWVDLYIAGNRGFEGNINNIIIYYI